jgi:hypothetical protein
MTTNFTAELCDTYHSGNKIVGFVYNDISGRFRDGEVIRTSSIVSEEGDVVATRDGVYKIVTWHPSEIKYVHIPPNITSPIVMPR